MVAANDDRDLDHGNVHGGPALDFVVDKTGLPIHLGQKFRAQEHLAARQLSLNHVSVKVELVTLGPVKMFCLDSKDAAGTHDDVVHVEAFSGNVVEYAG